MLRRATFGLLGFAIALGVLMALFVISMRMKYRPVQDRVRQFARDAGNPVVMKTAGQPGATASIVRHVGRISGTSYETPVTIVETESGFVIALPYGTSPDWLKNVLAAGAAELIHEGATYQVDSPELVSAEVGNPHFPANTQLTHRLFSVDDFLMLQNVETG